MFHGGSGAKTKNSEVLLLGMWSAVLAIGKYLWGQLLLP